MNKKVLKVSGIVIVSALAGWFIHGMVGGKRGGMPPMGPRQMPPASVMAQTVKERPLQPVEEYIASIEAVQDVMVRSEVPGYIASVNFNEGGLVKEGDILFTIDPSSYQAAADAAKADMNRAQKLYNRMKSADARSISKSDMETAESDWLRAKANFEIAKVSLNYTKIKAPINGRIGVAQITKGNYVTAASGPLARIVQVDPVRVVFSLTDRDYLKFHQQELAGKESPLEAKIRLPDGTILPTLGKKDFDDNAMNPQTGTIAVRYLFDNPDGLLVPGGYVKILLDNPAAPKGIAVPQRAVLTDQQGSYVLTVDESGKWFPLRAFGLALRLSRDSSPLASPLLTAATRSLSNRLRSTRHLLPGVLRAVIACAMTERENKHSACADGGNANGNNECRDSKRDIPTLGDQLRQCLAGQGV